MAEPINIKRNRTIYGQINCEIIRLSFVISLNGLHQFQLGWTRATLFSSHILWHRSVFFSSILWFYGRNSYSKHTYAHASFRLNPMEREKTRTHYLWSNSLANRLLYNSMPSYYIYYIETFFLSFHFGFSLLLSDHFHIWIRWRASEHRKKRTHCPTKTYLIND